MKIWRDIQEQILIARLRSGKRAAFETLLDRYERRVYHLALRLLGGDVAEAEDAVQEVFVSVYKGLGDFRGECSLDTWIHRLAINICLQRARKRHPELSNDTPKDDGVEVASVGSDPARLALHAELQAQLSRAVEALPEPQQAVVLLHGMQGFTYAEVASILDCPVGTVKSRLNAAFGALRRSLGDYVLAEDAPVNVAAFVAKEASL